MKREGVITIVDPDPPRGQPQVREKKTFTCNHCQAIVDVSKNGEPGKELDYGRCGRCDHFICGPCCDELARTLKCVPFEERLRQFEARDRLKRAV